jgi:uncharacterized PurR-regulated membrane protein YhhQ (DUF165 family)
MILKQLLYNSFIDFILEQDMKKKDLYINAILFAILIIISNYTVQFPINEWLTYGAIVYPFTFLITDILSEKYSKKEVLRVVQIGSVLAIIPTIMIADFRIAIASIFTFIVVQQFDIVIFHKIKVRYPNLWWLRNNASTMISQFFDTVLFFILAFSFIMPFSVIIKLIIGDYFIKFIMALLDTPIFYYLAIRVKKLRR